MKQNIARRFISSAIAASILGMSLTACNSEAVSNLQNPTPIQQHTSAPSLAVSTPALPENPTRDDIAINVSQRIDELSVRSTLEHLTGVAPAPLSTGAITIAERGSDSGRQAAAQYMKESFESLGLTSRIIEFSTSSGKTGYNVEATLPGQNAGQEDEKHLWITAHLDSAHNAGASDDASGLTSILMTARALHDLKPRDTIHFVAYDFEEIGLVGSSRYVNSVVASVVKEKGSDAVIGNIHSDMMGYDTGSNEGVIGSCDQGGEIPTALQDAAALIKSPIRLEEDCLGRSDHEHFWSADLPAVIIVDSSKYDKYPWYHKSGDTLDKLNIPYLQSMIQASASAVVLLTFDRN